MKYYNYIFNLDNTWINKIFLYYVKKKLNKSSYYLVLRGRHPNRKELFEKIGKKYSKEGQNDVPIKYAKSIGVYLRMKRRNNKWKK